MKRLKLLTSTIAALCIWLSAVGQQVEPQTVKTNYQTDSYDTTHTFRHGGLVREYRIYTPKDLAPDAPLVFVLHGYGGSNDLRKIGFNAVADREGFAVCYPQGSKDGRGKRCWNVGYPFQSSMQVDDVSFLCQLARHLQKHHSLDPHRTYCTGMSNGGEMCYLLAFKASEVFAAVAPVAGLTMEWMYTELSHKRPIPLFEIHGTEDRTSEWFGDTQNKGGWGAYMPVPIAVGYWVAANRCKNLTEEQIPSTNRENGRSIVAHRYTNGVDGNEVWLYEIRGGTHSWGTSDMATADVVWSFFKRFKRK